MAKASAPGPEPTAPSKGSSRLRPVLAFGFIIVGAWLFVDVHFAFGVIAVIIGLCFVPASWVGIGSTTSTPIGRPSEHEPPPFDESPPA